MNERATVDGRVYERNESKSFCTGCAFHNKVDWRCDAADRNDIHCESPRSIWLAVDHTPVLEPDEQCGVGNG